MYSLRALAILFVIAAAAAPAPAHAQEAPAQVSGETGKAALAPVGKDESVARYERKSITYLEMLDLAGADDDIYRAVEREVRGNVELPRFDYNDVSRFRSLTPAEAARLVKDYLDKTKLARAKEQADYDVRFKDYTITGEDLRRIANSAYLYQPALRSARAHKERYVIYQNGRPMVVQRWVARVDVRVTFYSVDFEKGVAKEMAVIGASGSGSSTIGFLGDGGSRDAAIREAAASAGLQLRKDVRGVEAFNLLTPIAAAGANSVSFGLTKKEGLELDQGFYVYEYLTTGGRERVGYVKVTRVGDGKTEADSDAQNIYVSNGFTFDEGQLLQEHPQLGIRVQPEFGIQRFSMHVGKDLGMEESSSGARAQFSVAYDIAERVGIPEVHAVADLHVMASNFLEMGLEFGIDKRFYFRRLALTPGFRLGIMRNWWSFDPEAKGFDAVGNPQDVANLNGQSLGVSPRLGVEVFLTPEWSLTGYAGYRLYTPQTGEMLTNPDTDMSYPFDFEYDPSGVQGGVGLSYTF